MPKGGAAVVALSLFLALWGIRWGLPCRERLEAVLPPEARTPEFRAELERTWHSMYERLGPNPMDNWKELTSTGFESGDVVLPGWKTPPAQMMNPTRSLYLRSSNDDEAPIMVALSRIKPWKGEFNPKIYNYGGAYFYGLGGWIAAMTVVTPTKLARGLSVYLERPELMGWMFTSGRLFSALAYVLGAWLTYALGARFIGKGAGLWAGLFYAAAPGIVLQSHQTKPHLWGAVCSMLVFGLLAELVKENKKETKRWLWAGALVGLSAAFAPYFCLVAGLLPMAALVRGRLKEDAPPIIKAAVVSITVFLILNPWYVYETGVALRGLAADGKAAGHEPFNILNFAMKGFATATTWPIALAALAGFFRKGDKVLRFTKLAFLFYLATTFIMMTTDLIGARNFPAFYLGLILAGAAVTDKGSRLLGAGALGWALAVSLVMDCNFRLDSSAETSTRYEAGRWIEANIPPGEELGFLRLPQPSSTPYFQWSKYRLKFVDHFLLENQTIADKDLPRYLIEPIAIFDERPVIGPVLEKYYVRVKLIEPFRLPGIAIGPMYGNPYFDIYKKR
jgi:hypothetical protein